MPHTRDNTTLHSHPSPGVLYFANKLYYTRGWSIVGIQYGTVLSLQGMNREVWMKLRNL